MASQNRRPTLLPATLFFGGVVHDSASEIALVHLACDDWTRFEYEGTNDPHLHFGLSVRDTAVSAFPTIVESYLRMYPDNVIAMAGGYHFVEPGEAVLLDGIRSQARPGEEIVNYEWRLHDGMSVRQATVEVPFTVPGLFSEELIVRTANGAEARDYAQVRVYDENVVEIWSPDGSTIILYVASSQDSLSLFGTA